MQSTRRAFLGTSALAVAGVCLPAAPQPSIRPRPTSAQLRWQREELALFLHFGVNTFTDREWGDGTESPSIFAPTNLDARQWAKTARAAGFGSLVLTAKHHDGFCLWPTRTTRHSVASSPWRGGDGDLVREFTEACRAEGLGAGLYLSPWDRNHPSYGSGDGYNDVYITQLTELLTNYGPLVEVWFDGANGEGPNGKRQTYDWPRVWNTVRRLQPGAVMFSDAGPDVRWSGNEAGIAGDPNWSTVDPTVVTAPGMSGPGIIESLQHGHREGTVWRPAECDTSIRPGWFYHPAEDERVKSVDRLFQIYVQSVGRNSKLLLNVPPTPAGLLHTTDVERLLQWRALRARRFGDDLAGEVTRRPGSGLVQAEFETSLRRPTPVAYVRLGEDITAGQCVAQYVVQGLSGATWLPLSSGTTIGHARIDTVIDPAIISRLRVSVTNATATPGPLTIAVHPVVAS